MKNSQIKSVTVFCGSSKGDDLAFTQDCLELAATLHRNNITLVYGGGNIGLMGILADEMLRLGGEVIGVIPQKLADIEVAHHGVSKLHIVSTMHERKALMAGLSDAFLVLPGGIGTMDEFFEIFTWQQLGYHEKPVAICNINGFYDGLITFLNQLVQQKFIKSSQFNRLLIQNNSVALIDNLLQQSGLIQN